MSDEKRQARRRRRRAERLESSIVLILVVAIIASLGLCVFLTVKIHGLNQGMANLNAQIESLSNTVDTQQQQADKRESQMWEELQAAIEAVEENVQDIPQQQEEQAADSYAGMHKVYLTFDDGPSKYTPEILAILEQYDIKATFFVVGKESDSAKEYIQDIVEQGHTLGMHSYSHKYGEIYSSVENFAADFDKQQQYLYRLTGEACMIYRFPGGSSNTVSAVPMSEFARYLDGRGVIFYDWNIVSGDGVSELLTVEELVANSTTGIGREESSIILLHDSADKSTTVEALPQIIENILALENTVILPITEETMPVQHIQWRLDKATNQTGEGTEG